MAVNKSPFKYSSRAGGYIRKPTREGINYDDFATKEWALLISFFRWYPDILEDICEGENCEFHNSLMGRVTKRYQARYGVTFTYASRGYGKTTNVISTNCNKGILFPGEVIAYYAPTSRQAAPLASKAFSGYERNYPILAAHWRRQSDARDIFRINTINGSRFLMDIDRGIDTSCVVAEECGQEDKNPFNWEEFNQIVLGTNRKQYYVNGAPDPTHIDFQEHYITSASRKENEAYAMCRKVRQEMMNGESAYALWIPWQVPVLCRMKPYGYYAKLKKRLTAEQFMRECESKCTGSVDNPIVRDSILQSSRTLKIMESKHCGNPDAFYILGYDVSSRDTASNALTAMAVLKCERQSDPNKADHYKKSLVYVMDTRPPKTAREHAALIKRFWKNFRMKDGKETYIVIDARAYGKSVVESLHEELSDGMPPLATMTHEEPYVQLEKKNSVACIYPLQATGNVGRDPNTEMLDYIEREYENGNLLMLTANLVDGTQAYKLKHNIKDDNDDAFIQFPYLKTKELCQQINNLQKKYTTGGWIESEISKTIPKDMWSATLYACRLASRFEKDELYYLNRSSNEWEDAAEAFFDDNSDVYGEYSIRTRQVKRNGKLGIK